MSKGPGNLFKTSISSSYRVLKTRNQNFETTYIFILTGVCYCIPVIF